MTSDIVLSTNPNTPYVCDSLHLAQQLGVRHDNLLKSFRKAQESIKCATGSLLPVEERTLGDKRGKTYPVMYLTLQNLINLTPYVERLRPRMSDLLIKILAAQNPVALPAAKKKISKEAKRIKIYDEEQHQMHNVLAQSLDICELAQGIVDKTRAELSGKQAAFEKKLQWNTAIGCFCKESCYGPLPLPTMFNFRTEYDEILRDKLEDARVLHELADYAQR